MIWSSVLEVAGLLTKEGSQRELVDAGREVVRDTPRLTAAVRDIVNADRRFASLRSEVAFLAEHADEVLGRWAGVMLGSEVYAEVIDRHVELGGDVAWIAGIFDATYPPSDMRRQRRARSSPAVEIESELGAEWLADRIVVITQLAEELDRRTLELALRIVPVRWWEERSAQTSRRPAQGDPPKSPTRHLGDDRGKRIGGNGRRLCDARRGRSTRPRVLDPGDLAPGRPLVCRQVRPPPCRRNGRPPESSTAGLMR